MLHCVDEGQGRAVVLLHAFPLDGRMWDAQVVALKKRCRVVVPDLAGFGRSKDVRAASVEEHADQVAQLLAARGVQRATVVGLSMGGYVALALAQRHPQLLDALVMCDSKASPDSDAGKQGRTASITSVQAPGGVAALVEGLVPKLLAKGVAPALAWRVTSLGGEQDALAVAAALGAMRDRPDRMDVVASLKVPLLCVVGSLDGITPPADSAAMAKAAANGRVVELAGAGHLSNLEAPSQFNAALMDFLDALPG